MDVKVSTEIPTKSMTQLELKTLMRQNHVGVILNIEIGEGGNERIMVAAAMLATRYNYTEAHVLMPVEYAAHSGWYPLAMLRKLPVM